MTDPTTPLTIYIVPLAPGQQPVRDLVRLTQALRDQGFTIPDGDGVALQNLPDGSQGYLVHADKDPTEALRTYVEQPTPEEQQQATWRQDVKSFIAAVDKGTAPPAQAAAQVLRGVIGLLAARGMSMTDDSD